MSIAKVSFFCERFLPFILMAIALFIPISYRVTIYLLDVALITWLLSDGWYKQLKTAFRNRIVFFTAFFWLLVAFSLLYTKNIEGGFTKIVQYAPILFVPIMVTTQRNEIIKYLRHIENAFLLGLTITAIYLVARALLRSIYITPIGILFYPIPPGAPWENYFFYQLFTEPFHPTYLSMNYCLGIILLASRIKGWRVGWLKLIGVLVGIFFVLILFFSSSRAGYITGVLLSFISLFWVLKHRGKIYATILIALLLVGFSILLPKNERYVRFKGFFKAQSEDISNESSLEQKLKSEDAVRLKIWQTIPSVVGKNWLFGLGIGDVRETLAKAYQEKNMDFALNKRLNAHNQYLETYVGLGLIGLSCLLLILGSALWQSIRRRDMVFFLFMLIILINFMFESVLERFFGVLFFVFFLSIFSMREVDSV